MSVKQPQDGSPFLIDESTGNIVGVRSADGTANYLTFVIPAEATPANGAQATITTDMTNENADVTVTAENYGAEGNLISVTYVDPDAEDAELAVSVSGNDIVVSLATDGDKAITSTAAEVAAAINSAAGDLVTAAGEGDGSGVVEAVAKAYLEGGVDVTPGPIGSLAFDEDALYVKVLSETWKKISFDVE